MQLSFGEGGGNSVVRSVGNSKQRSRRRQWHREKRKGGTEMVGGSGRKGSVGVLGRLLRQGRKKGRWYLGGRGGRSRGGGCGDYNGKGSKQGVGAVEGGDWLADSSGREAREEGSTVGCGRGVRGWERWVATRMAMTYVGKMGKIAARPAVGSGGQQSPARAAVEENDRG
ncbi:hypothetical protein B296_00025942 [Ensete ventricosum]|uniref:Uncharacterized protein n=1 Tax=Ensete ventricosum TaxID=4639 RepID=A0A426ZRL7_ENSVE|nr:hypothetical protein B296_00025942 [Ensete ventricosum]